MNALVCVHHCDHARFNHTEPLLMFISTVLITYNCNGTQAWLVAAEANKNVLLVNLKFFMQNKLKTRPVSEDSEILSIRKSQCIRWTSLQDIRERFRTCPERDRIMFSFGTGGRKHLTKDCKSRVLSISMIVFV